MSQTITGIVIGLLLLFVVLYSCIRSAKDGDLEKEENDTYPIDKNDTYPIDKKE